MEKNKIELIEDLPFEPDDLMYILLVANGDKPSAWVHLTSQIWREGDEQKSIDPSLLDSVKLCFDEIGLVYEFSKRVTPAGLNQSPDGRKRLNELYDIYIARNGENLASLVDARKQQDNKKLGIALGYPITAVEAYGTDNRISVKELPIEARLSEAAQFSGFMLSKNAWQDEVKHVAKWVDTVRDLSPIIYQAYIHRCFEVSPELVELVVHSLADRPESSEYLQRGDKH